MEGQAHQEHLLMLLNNTETEPLYRQFVNPGWSSSSRPSWAEFDNVWVRHNDAGPQLRNKRRGRLSVGFGERGSEFGPELSFGAILGEIYADEPILLVKCAWGATSLAVDWKPPSAPPTVHSYADAHNTGRRYNETMGIVHDTLRDLSEWVPGYNNSWGYDLVAFLWFQGFNDVVDPRKLGEYETNLGHLVSDVRRDLAKPNLLFMIGELGMAGLQPAFDTHVELRAIQLRVARSVDNTVFVRTSQFAKIQPEVRFDGIHHYYGRADTFVDIGRAFAVPFFPEPTMSPFPSQLPSHIPSNLPSSSSQPSNVPSLTVFPSTNPSNIPSTPFPSLNPSSSPFPSSRPSLSALPSNVPSILPSASPSTSTNPTLSPTTTFKPSSSSQPPSLQPSVSSVPSVQPSHEPTEYPTRSSSPSIHPTHSSYPSSVPTQSAQPTPLASEMPSFSIVPTTEPSRMPSDVPTRVPTMTPTTSFPSVSRLPSTFPSGQPSSDRICDDAVSQTFFVEAIGEHQRCIWLASRPEFWNSLCRIPGGVAYDICEETCGKCVDLCPENRRVRVVIDGIVRDCHWLSLRPAVQQRVCVESHEAFRQCPDTCNSCEDVTASPSGAPSLPPTNLPSNLPTIAPSLLPLPSLSPNTVAPSPTPSTTTRPPTTIVPLPTNSPSRLPSPLPTQSIPPSASASPTGRGRKGRLETNKLRHGKWDTTSRKLNKKKTKGFV